MKEQLQVALGILIIIFAIWIISGIMYEINIPFWTINFPLTGFIVTVLAFKIIDKGWD